MSIFSTFEKKYPLFDKFIKDEYTRNSMLKDKNVYKKYVESEDSIRIYIYELKKRFKDNEIELIIKNFLLRLNSTEIISFVASFLESDEEVKNNIKAYDIYKDIVSKYGSSAINYMECNGIVSTDKFDYSSLKNEVDSENNSISELDNEYKNYLTDNIIYNDVKLDDIFYELPNSSKKFVLGLLKNKTFSLFIDLFRNFDYNFKSLINLLAKINIDSTIIDYNVLEFLSMYELMILICQLIDYSDPNIVDNIKYLVSINKVDVLKNILVNDCVKYLSGYTKDDLLKKSDEQLISDLVKEKILSREI